MVEKLGAEVAQKTRQRGKRGRNGIEGPKCPTLQGATADVSSFLSGRYQLSVPHCLFFDGNYRRINGKLGKDPPIYDFVKFLFKEGKKVNATCKIITCKNIKMERRKNTREKQAHLTELWNQFEEGEIDSKELLEEAAKFSPSFDVATKKKNMFQQHRFFMCTTVIIMSSNHINTISITIMNDISINNVTTF